jgi:hypothetical protein
MRIQKHLEGAINILIDEYWANVMSKLVSNTNVWQTYMLWDMRYYADAADAVCVEIIKLCVKFMLEFTGFTRNVTT